jgi:hypothetical protein
MELEHYEGGILQRDDSDRPTKVWMEVDAKLKVVSYTLGYDYSDAPGTLSWTLVDGDVKELEGSYAFDQSGDVTQVSYEMRIDPGSSFPPCCAVRPRGRSRAPRWKA